MQVVGFLRLVDKSGERQIVNGSNIFDSVAVHIGGSKIYDFETNRKLFVRNGLNGFEGRFT